MKEKEEKPVWLSPKEMYQKYKVKMQTQAKWRMLGKIPFYKIGKFVKYQESEIDEWIKEHKVIGVESCKK